MADSSTKFIVWRELYSIFDHPPTNREQHNQYDILVLPKELNKKVVNITQHFFQTAILTWFACSDLPKVYVAPQ